MTRTLHFGEPREIEKEVYTKLLKGCIDIASTTFKEGYKRNELEILLRSHLYESGLDYGHGSTHGIGSFLSVHECKTILLLHPIYYSNNFTFFFHLQHLTTLIIHIFSAHKNRVITKKMTLE